MTTDSTVDDRVVEYLNFGVGVLSLVCLTCSVIWGLVAQDRILLDARRRILAQAVHRTTALASLVFLVVHIVVKLLLDHTTWIAVVIPFGLALTDDEVATGRAFLIGLGTLAGLLMVFVAITGLVRNRFASPAPVAARWRAVHMLAYPAWCAGLVHGLYAGRAAAPLFTTLYALSVVAVGGALALRAAPRPVKRRVADKITALLSTEQQPGREELDASRARATAESALPGYESAPAGRGDRRAEAPMATPAETTNGFAAAYRAVSRPARAREASYADDRTAPMELPDLQPTQAVPRVDTGTSGSWPVPSPPPVGEAPPSAYDPLQDTGYNIPAYGSPAPAGYGSSDLYDTGETNTLYGTYNTNDTYDNSGPATETLPGASYDFDAPGSGEPWNTPSGGFK
ncbi:ferric reductase-like transmembrane domain-containing protein [Streptomyces sp. B93]|uniref:ferric reductase-like transmembrane domain-containing protein n=1 Tax=Streptomyces sp. B93 TaxID=2824875 RepID=UPI001B384B64|nr:ferric reductase-like transmembrane domain-containing protein [Streptomyces sp. B93]MBQ1088183.1 cytochrome b/b6 domain-containing protein [Streptomyces sp. B93]